MAAKGEGVLIQDSDDVAFEPQPQRSLPVPVPEEMRLIELAINRGAGIETIERMYALAKDMRRERAEVAFNAAMNKAQSEIGRVAPNLTNSSTQSKYASYDALDSVVRPIYTKHGFALQFDEGDSPKPDHVRVLCYCSHEAGFTRTFRKDICADGKGAKGGAVMTPTHAEGAADSYGMRYLLKKIFNMAVGEYDNDGNVQPRPINGKAYPHLDDRLRKMAHAKSVEELQTIYKAAFAEAFDQFEDMSALKSLNAALAKGRQELAR